MMRPKLMFPALLALLTSCGDVAGPSNATAIAAPARLDGGGSLHSAGMSADSLNGGMIGSGGASSTTADNGTLGSGYSVSSAETNGTLGSGY
jgi:hypothetical protein